jgi:hypothetical protein
LSGPIAPPIVVAEGHDVTFHRTVADVGAYYESWFPDTVEHRAFDAEGRRLELYAEGPELQVRPGEAEPSGATELADLLRAQLRGRRSSDPVIDTLGLERLLSLAVARAGYLP